jgi:FtsP/CotA-like multicopper oxidase with cupredoxin domain
MKFSRRTLIYLGGLGLVGAAAAFMAKEVKNSRVKTPVSFLQPGDLPNLSKQNGTAEFSLVAKRSLLKLPGEQDLTAALMTYNDRFPGPTMRVKEGDRVRIQFRNELEEPTNLHFHGLHISPTGQGDNVFRTVNPGETALYEFQIPRGSAGTYWYHPHLHGNANTQLFAGLSGTIIVDDFSIKNSDLRNIPDHLIVLKDLEIDNQGNVPPLGLMDWMNGREGDRVMVNGLIQPTLNVNAGLVRLRLSNQSVGRYFNLKLKNNSMLVIATDGGFVNTPYKVESLLLTPGERYEVLVQASESEDMILLNQPYDRGMMGMMPGMPGMPGMSDSPQQRAGYGELMTLKVIAAGVNAKIPDSLNSIKTLTPEVAIQKRILKFTERMGMMSSGMENHTAGMKGMMSFSFNGQPFDRDLVDIRAKLGTVELWELVNDTDMDHPFHLHVNAFQIYSRNGQREIQLAWKDVVNVRSKETVQILVPFNDYVGKTMFHCHLLEHEELGMMGVVEIV